MRCRPHLVAFVSLTLIGLSGCGDASFFENSPAEDASTSTSDETRESTARLVPEFQLSGQHELPRELFVEQMDFRVAEVRFEPIDDPEASIGYVTSDPLHLAFELGESESYEKGDPIALPSPGRYEVTLRLESANSPDNASSSVTFSGYFPVDASSCRKPREVASGDGSNDGDPIPIPYEPDRTATDRSASPSHWGDFSYQSTDSYRYSLGEVELTSGLQSLRFTFDVGAWGRELKRPISRALDRHECPELQRGGGGANDSKAVARTLSVDVSDEVDQFGEGPEAMEDHLSVQTRSRAELPSQH